MNEVVNWINAPIITSLLMWMEFDAVSDRISHIWIVMCVIDLHTCR